jgi:hypothetical protein
MEVPVRASRQTPAESTPACHRVRVGHLDRLVEIGAVLEASRENSPDARRSLAKDGTEEAIRVC